MQCIALAGGWAYGGVVKCQGLGVYFLELQCDEVSCAYNGSEKDKIEHVAVAALVFHSRATV